MEHSGAVVPVAEHPLIGPAIADDVSQAELQQARERCTLGGRNMRVAFICGGVKDVYVRRRDVHVAAHDRGLCSGV